ncbi:hypothetical protein Tco_0410307 [Tanacetum coccineum]
MCFHTYQGSGKHLNEEELEFLADLGVAEGPVTQTVITHNASYQADDLDAYDFDCDDFSTAKAVLMANLSSYGSDVLSEVPYSKNTHNDMLNQSVQEMLYSEQTHLVNYLENEITSDNNIIPYSQYLLETQNAVVQDTNSSAQQDAMILSVFEQLSNQVTNCNKVNKDNLIANESLSTELEKYKERVKLIEERQNMDLSTQEKLIMDDIIRDKNAQFADFKEEINYLKQSLSEQSKEKELLTKTFNVFKNESKEKEAKNIDKEIALEKKVKELDKIVFFQNPLYLKKAQQIRPMFYDGSVIAKETNVISIPDSEETLMLEEESRSKMLLKQVALDHYRDAFSVIHLIYAHSIDTVMSDSDESGVTHTEISSPFEDLSDIGSPGVVGPEHEGLPWMLDDPYVQVALQAPPSPDYIPGPEEPQSPPLPDFVLEPVYPEYMPQEDEVFLAEEQPLPTATSPTAQLSDYVPESDPEADLEEDDDKDPEEDPADGGDDDDDEDEPSDDDEDEKVDIEVDDEEEDEHPAPADSAVVALQAANQAPSAEETEPFETDESAATPPPHPAYRVTARISIPTQVPTPVWSDAEIPSPSLPLSPPSPVLSPAPPPSPIRSLGYRAAMIRLRAEAASTSHSLPLPPPFILSPTRSDAPSSGIPPPLPISVPTSSPPLLLPSASRREDRPEVTLPPRKRLGIALGPRYEVGESSSAAAARPAGGLRADYGFVATMDREIRRDPEREVGYGITDSWDEIVETLQGAPVSTDMELGRHMTAFETRVRQDTDEIYTRRSMDASDLAHREVISLRTTVQGQMSEIRELHAADRRRQAVTSEMLKADHRRSAEMRELRTTDHTRQQQLIQTLTVMQSLQGQVTILQGQVTALQGHVTALQGQQGPVRGPAQLELPEEAGGSS